LEPEGPLLSGQAGSLQHGLSLFRILDLLECHANMPRQSRLRHPLFLSDDANVSADDDVSLAPCGAWYYPIQEPLRPISE
jgi:hypothetical protein